MSNNDPCDNSTELVIETTVKQSNNKPACNISIIENHILQKQRTSGQKIRICVWLYHFLSDLGPQKIFIWVCYFLLLYCQLAFHFLFHSILVTYYLINATSKPLQSSATQYNNHYFLSMQVFSGSRLGLTDVGIKLKVSLHLLQVSFMLPIPVGGLGHVIFVMMVEEEKSKPKCTSTLQISINFIYVDISLGKSSHMTKASISGAARRDWMFASYVIV